MPFFQPLRRICVRSSVVVTGESENAVLNNGECILELGTRGHDVFSYSCVDEILDLRFEPYLEADSRTD